MVRKSLSGVIAGVVASILVSFGVFDGDVTNVPDIKVKRTGMS